MMASTEERLSTNQLVMTTETGGGAGEEGDQTAQGAADAQHPQALRVGVEQIVADQQQVAEYEQLLAPNLASRGLKKKTDTMNEAA